MSVVSFVCFQVEVSAMGRSLVRRSPTECGACLYVISELQQRGGHDTSRAVVRQKERKKKLYVRNMDCCHYAFLCIPCHFLPLRPTLFSINLVCSTLMRSMLFALCMPMPCVLPSVRTRTMDATFQVGPLSVPLGLSSCPPSPEIPGCMYAAIGKPRACSEWA